MKKKLLIIGVSILVIGLVFAAGTFVKAGSDWQSNAINNSYSEFLSTANNTTNGLVKDINSDVNNTINTAIQSDVDQKQAELQRLLEEYYRLKLAGMTETDEFKKLEQTIKEIQASVLKDFKDKIDAEFAKQTSGK